MFELDLKVPFNDLFLNNKVDVVEALAKQDEL